MFMVPYSRRKLLIYYIIIMFLILNMVCFATIRYYKVAVPTNVNVPKPFFNVNVGDFMNLKKNFSYMSYIDSTVKYVIHYNSAPSLRHFHPLESVTLTTQGDLRYLGDLGAITHRWIGPISVALYAPGSDWVETLRAVAYLRNCVRNREEIRELVSFHLFSEKEYAIENKAYSDQSDCSVSDIINLFSYNTSTFRSRNNLPYPINTARNIARRAAHTYFLFSMDLELLPSTNFIPAFMQMINSNPQLVATHATNVFVLPIFELLHNVTQIPETKKQLLRLIAERQAFLFHEKLCLPCHDFPGRAMWIQQRNMNRSMSISGHTKRIGAYFMWEPFYVGTNTDPWFDERFTWEGQSNKMIQAYQMCLLNYTFLVLDNAFLVHKPGIKPLKVQIQNINFRRHIYYINDRLKPRLKIELQDKLGANKKCYI